MTAAREAIARAWHGTTEKEITLGTALTR